MNKLATTKERFKFGLKWTLLTIALPLTFDIYNLYTLISIERTTSLFPRYQLLEKKDKDEFDYCMFNFGPFSRLVCPFFFKERESLLIPTKENLSRAIKKCQLTQYPTPGVEEHEICVNTLENLAEKGSAEDQKTVFDYITKNIEKESCFFKAGYFVTYFKKFKNLPKNLIDHYRFNQIMESRCVNGFSNPFEDSRDPRLWERYQYLFSKLEIDSTFKGYHEDIYIYIIELDLYFKGHGKEKLDKNPPTALKIGKRLFLKANKKNQSKELASLVKEFLKIEHKEISKLFPYHLIEDTSWIKVYK